MCHLLGLQKGVSIDYPVYYVEPEEGGLAPASVVGIEDPIFNSLLDDPQILVNQPFFVEVVGRRASVPILESKFSERIV